MAIGKKSMRIKCIKSKGKRWKKGHSCSSNPSIATHRSAAKNKFFQPQTSNSNLTLEAVKQHDININDNETDENMEKMSIDLAMSEGKFSQKTFSTWASNYTGCTNSIFNRVHRYWSSNSDLHKEILAVVAAITEVIKEKDGNENETEYFAALMTTLETSETELSKAATAYLLSIVIKKVPESVLKSRFNEISKIFIDILANHLNVELPTLLRSILVCLGKLLKCQEFSRWSEESTIHIYNSLLMFCINSKPRVRKSAQEAVREILNVKNDSDCHPAAISTAKFCIENIEKFGGSGSENSNTFHVLGLLKQIMSILPKRYMKITCEMMLKLLTLSTSIITISSLQVLHTLFMNKPTVTSLPADLNGQLLTALYDYVPSENDSQIILAWLSVMESGTENLIKNDSTIGMQHATKLLLTCLKYLQSTKSDVCKFTFNTIENIFKKSIEPNKDAFITKFNDKNSVALKMFQYIESCLSYQYHTTWDKILDIIAIFFQVFGKHCAKYCKKCLQMLADLRENSKFTFKAQLERAVGFAVRYIGPDIVLLAIPLQITGENDNYDFPRSWLLPVLRDYVQETSLNYFITYFLPLSAKLREKSAKFSDENRLVEAKSYDALQAQIWSLFPKFCTRPTDLNQSFPTIAKLIGTALNERPDIRMEILQALRKLLFFSLENEENKSVMGKFSKNFIPILLNLYVSSGSTDHRNNKKLAILETIKMYFKVTNLTLICTFFDNCIEKINSENESSLNKYLLADIALSMIPFLDIDHLSILMQFSLENIESIDSTLQKKSYRMLEEMSLSESIECRKCVKNNLTQLENNLLKTLSSSSPSAKGSRLNCLLYIIKQLESDNMQFVQTILPEVILCTKEAASKSRIVANNLLLEIYFVLKRWRENDSNTDVVKDYLYMIMAGLTGSPHMVSSTTLAVSIIVFKCKDDIPEDLLIDLIEMTCALLLYKSREVVDSALTLLKVVLGQFPCNILHSSFPNIINHLIKMNDENKHHFRFKTKSVFGKLIKKFGVEHVSKSVPESMQKVIRNIKKVQERNKRLKERSNETNENDTNENEEKNLKMKGQSDKIDELLEDTDSELDDGIEDRKKAKVKSKNLKNVKERKGSAWIQENVDFEEIVDFMDKGVTKNVLSSKPIIKKKLLDKNRGFKTTEDGRLIIEEKEIKSNENKNKNPNDDIDGLSDLLETLGGGNMKKAQKRKISNLDIDEENPPMKYQPGGTGIHRAAVKHVKKNETFGADQYKAKKAHGDIKKKGKPDPYAYVPLEFTSLNKRKRAKITGRFKNLVKGAQKGALKGQKVKSKKNKQK